MLRAAQALGSHCPTAAHEEDALPTALITGANRGLGRETARQLARQGYTVIVTARREASGHTAVDEIRKETGGDVYFHPLDVTDPVSIQTLLVHASEEWPTLNAVVNNAGVSLNGFDSEVVRKTLAVNFYGAAAVTDALAPLIPRNGRLVMVSSGLGELSGVAPPLRDRFAAQPLQRDELRALVEEFAADVAAGDHRDKGWPSSAYNVSKIALNAFTRIAARELAEREVKVNAVCPGWVRTDMGGAGASRSVEEGADTIVWAAGLGPDGPTGGFFRDRAPARW